MSNYGSSVEQCPLAEKYGLGNQHNSKLVTCEFDLVRLYKVGSKHSGPLMIDPSYPSQLFIYEVVSGETANQSAMVLSVAGITVVNCKQHKNDVVSIISQAPMLPTTNENSENNFNAIIDYSDGLFQNPRIYRIYVDGCNTRGRCIHVLAYPDRKITVFAKATLEIESEGDLKNSIEFSIDGEWDGKGKQGTVSGTLSKEVNKPLEWELKFSGKWGKVEGEFQLEKQKGYTDTFKDIYEGKRNFWRIFNKHLLGSGGKDQGVLKKWNFSMDVTCKYQNYWEEDKDTFLVGKHSELIFDGTLFKIEWVLDITSKLFLTLGWAGYILDKLRKAMEEAELATLSAEVKIIGEFSITELNFTKVTLSNKEVKKSQGDKTEANAFIGLSIVIKGSIRIDQTTYGAEIGVKKTGIDCKLKDGKAELKFTGLSVTLKVYKSTSKVSEQKIPEKYKKQLSVKGKDVKIGNVIIDEVEVTETKDKTEFSAEKEIIKEFMIYPRA